MPLIDLPIEKLQEYHGRNPKPADFDTFWDTALAEVIGVAPQLHLELADFQLKAASCHHAWFDSVGGARLHAKVLLPRNPFIKLPCAVLFHGYSGRSGDWMSLASWVSAGYAVIALDVRGQAGLSQDPGSVPGNTLKGHIIRGVNGTPEQLFYRGVFLDTVQTVNVAANLPGVDPTQIVTFGASQGGGLSLACAALSDKVTKCGTMYPFLSDYQRVWEMDQAKDAYDEIKAYLKMFDPTHQHVEEFFERLGYIDIQHLAPRVKADTIMITGLMDTITPPSTQFAAYNKLTCAKDMVIYPDFGHEGLPESLERVVQYFQANP
jgi:cephalosporin-C deacetylase